MKAITIHQPWASLIACGEKQIETRRWPTKYRGPIAIHAGKKPLDTNTYFDRELYRFADALGLPDIYRFYQLPYGTVIAIAELVECWKVSYKHIPLKHSMEYYRQPNLVYTATIYADKERTIPVKEEVFTVPAQSFTRPCGGEFKETWLCENDKGEFRDIGGSETMFGHFESGRYAWELANVRPIEPVPAKGRQRLWEWNEEGFTWADQQKR